jgi:hypothetical protein
MLHPTDHAIRYDLDARIARDDRNRWIVSGVAALTVTAALVMMFAVARHAEVVTPAAIAPPVTAPPVTAPPATEPPATAPPAIPTSAPTPAPPATTPPAIPTSAPTIAPEAPHAGAPIVFAGQYGVTVLWADGTLQVATQTPASFATRTADGSIWVQPIVAPSGPAFAPLGVVDNGQISPVALPAELAGDVRLHDAATIGDEPVLLVEQPPASCLGAPACEGTLWAFRPSTGTADLVATASVWEGGWSRLALTAGGVVVGEYGAGPVVSPFAAVIPGATASPIDVGALGLHGSYVDCDCPSSFTIDSTGEFLAWLAPDPANGRAVTIARLSDGQTLVVPVGQIAAPFTTIDIGAVAIDGSGAWSGTVLLNDRDAAAPQPPVRIDLGGGNQPVAGIEPGTASFGS